MTVYNVKAGVWASAVMVVISSIIMESGTVTERIAHYFIESRVFKHELPFVWSKDFAINCTHHERSEPARGRAPDPCTL